MRGYTLLELLVVIALGAILIGIVINEIRGYISYSRLKEAENQILSDLNFIKNQALITGLPWGIRACGGTNRYKIFVDFDGDCKDEAATCNSSDNLNVCINLYTQTCNSDFDCRGIPMACQPRSRYFILDQRVFFNATFYAVFDRYGYVLNYSCGNGEGNLTLVTPNGYSVTIKISRLGRIGN